MAGVLRDAAERQRQRRCAPSRRRVRPVSGRLEEAQKVLTQSIMRSMSDHEVKAPSERPQVDIRSGGIRAGHSPGAKK
jgi:hypothetical protein